MRVPVWAYGLHIVPGHEFKYWLDPSPKSPVHSRHGAAC